MGGSELEVAIFMDTDLGTHFAIAVPPDITVGALKREVERVHFNCFPKIGEIKVHGFMLKQKSIFYHLPDTLLLKFASSGLEGFRSLFVKATPSNDFIEPSVPEITDCIPILSNSTGSDSRSTCKNKIRVDCKKRTRKRLRRKQGLLSRSFCRYVMAWNTRRKRKGTNRKQLFKCTKRESDMEYLITAKVAGYPGGSTDKRCCPDGLSDNEGETRKQSYVSSLVEASESSSSETISVSSIIRRYFPSFDEVSSVASSRDTQSQPEKYLKKNMAYKFNASPQFPTNRAPNLLPFPLASNERPQKPERSKIGKRLIMASYHLGISPTRERPEISLCNSKGRKLQEFMSTSLAKSSCFEISDSED